MCAMDRFETPEDIERRAKAAGVNINELCRRAEIAVTTLWRWKGGSAPNIKTYQRVIAALEGAEAETQQTDAVAQ